MANRSAARALTAGAGAALLALTLGACGNDDSGDSDSSGSSAKSSEKSGGSDAKAMTKDDIGQRLLAAQRKAKTYSFDIEGTVAGQSLDGEGDVNFDQGGKLASRSEVEQAGQKVETVLIGDVTYFKAPNVTGDPKKPWLRIDKNTKTGAGGLMNQMGGGNNDPTATVRAFEGASKVEKGGTEKVDGVETTKYSIEIPRDAMAKALKFPEQATQFLPEVFAYDIWVDDKDLLHRMSSSLDVQGQQVKTDLTLDDYGEPVTVSEPPAGQISTPPAS